MTDLPDIVNLMDFMRTTRPVLAEQMRRDLDHWDSFMFLIHLLSNIAYCWRNFFDLDSRWRYASEAEAI